jgi:hypothetical protein
MYISENMEGWHSVCEDETDFFSVSFECSLHNPYTTIRIIGCLTSFLNIICLVLLKTCNNIKVLKSDAHVLYHTFPSCAAFWVLLLLSLETK